MANSSEPHKDYTVALPRLSLHFDYSGNITDILNLHPQITTIYFNNRCNNILPPLQHIKKIIFRTCYAKPLPPTPALTHLRLSDWCNQLIPCIPTLTHLILGPIYNQPLASHPNLEYLLLGHSYNQQLPILPSLSVLMIGGQYNQRMDLTQYSNLTELSMPLTYTNIVGSPNLQILSLNWPGLTESLTISPYYLLEFNTSFAMYFPFNTDVYKRCLINRHNMKLKQTPFYDL